MNETYGTNWIYVKRADPNRLLRTPEKQGRSGGLNPSGLRFPFGYVVCGSSPHWLAMFDGTSAPSGLEAIPSRTNDFCERGFREIPGSHGFIFL
jgi:hypothetical protein